MTALAKNAQCGQSGTEINRVTNYFPVGFSTAPQGKPTPGTAMGPKTCDYTGHSPNGEPTPIILLNGHSINPTPNDLSLYID